MRCFILAPLGHQRRRRQFANLRYTVSGRLVGYLCYTLIAGIPRFNGGPMDFRERELDFYDGFELLRR